MARPSKNGTVAASDYTDYTFLELLLSQARCQSEKVLIDGEVFACSGGLGYHLASQREERQVGGIKSPGSSG